MTNRIKLTAEGRAIVRLNVKPLDSLRLESVRYKLDTGADLTTISKKDLNILGYGVQWIEKNTVKDEAHMLSSAGGRSVTAYYVQIPIVNLFGKDFRNWPFYIHVEADRDFPNLLVVHFRNNLTNIAVDFSGCLGKSPQEYHWYFKGF